MNPVEQHTRKEEEEAVLRLRGDARPRAERRRSGDGIRKLDLSSAIVAGIGREALLCGDVEDA
jgi:hypothetical protein